MDAIAESGGNLASNKHQIPFLVQMLRMSRLARDGTAEPVSRDDIFIFPVQITTSRIDNHTTRGCSMLSVERADHTYKQHIYYWYLYFIRNQAGLSQQNSRVMCSSSFLL